MAFNKSKYDQQYAKDHIRRKHIPFNDTDPEDMMLLDWINKQQNATQYIKKLVREDMGNNGKPYLVEKVIEIENDSESYSSHKYCPSCRVGFGWFYPPNFCPKCGQKIDTEHSEYIGTKTIDKRTKSGDS